jgi:hypothetical protein
MSKSQDSRIFSETLLIIFKDARRCSCKGSLHLPKHSSNFNLKLANGKKNEVMSFTAQLCTISQPNLHRHQIYYGGQKTELCHDLSPDLATSKPSN